MIKTPVDLYRRGNATSPRMDHVRPNKDIAIYENNGQIWVKETLVDGQTPGGISTFSVQGIGNNWWKLDRGISIPSELELINDRGNHCLWKPLFPMSIETYQQALRVIGEFFYRVS
jgi:hypothetical protein